MADSRFTYRCMPQVNPSILIWGADVLLVIGGASVLGPCESAGKLWHNLANVKSDDGYKTSTIHKRANVSP
jgi:hypothetical protein